jgi:hypothetical protein
MRTTTKCRSVPFESSRSEDFFDIQLPVKGCASLAESFQKYGPGTPRPAPSMHALDIKSRVTVTRGFTRFWRDQPA